MKDIILIIEDSKLNSNFIKGNIEIMGYSTIQAFDGLEGFKVLAQNSQNIKAITLDRHMPNMDGMEFAKKVMSIEQYKSIPIIFITDLGDKKNILEGLEMGVYDYLPKPVDPDLLQVKIKNAVRFYKQELNLIILNKKLKDKNFRLEKLVASRTEKLKNLAHSILNILEDTATYNDKDTGNHIERVACYSELLAKKAGLCPKLVKDIKNYSPLHDIGKIGIPHEILKKPGKLTDEEFDEMKNHVIIGEELLANSTLPEVGVNIIKYHHERWRGGGYPNGVSGSEIPIEARIVTIADIFDALTSKRPYKEPFSIEKALFIMTKDMYDYFDPNLLKVFFDNIQEVLEIKERINNQEDYHI